MCIQLEKPETKPEQNHYNFTLQKRMQFTYLQTAQRSLIRCSLLLPNTARQDTSTCTKMSQGSFHNALKRHDTPVLKCSSFINHKLQKQLLAALNGKVLSSPQHEHTHTLEYPINNLDHASSTQRPCLIIYVNLTTFGLRPASLHQPYY